MIKNTYNILAVDDSTTFTAIIKEIITQNIPNTMVRIANSGMEAIRILGNNDIDLVILDVFMPVFDGIEMAKIIRSNHRTKRIPIIFMTGADPSNELKESALEIGGIDYISKSFKEDELIKLMNLYLRFINWEREINERLEDKIVELNHEIQRREQIERELKELSVKLHEANKTKDKFFSIIAHDLKNPLSSFKNMAGILFNEFQEMSDKELSEFLSAMKDSANGLYSLLENLLMWARTQTGAIVIKPELFNLKEIIYEVLNPINNLANDKKINLQMTIDDNLNVYADSNMISTVIRNFVTNAIKFTNFGGEVTVTALQTGDEVMVTVSDTGVGMNSDEVDKLFNIAAGQQSKLGTNREPGTGLGLVICNEFILKHKSRINVKSQEGVGTKFSFVLPANVTNIY